MSIRRSYQPKIVIPKAQLPAAKLARGTLDLPASPALGLLRKAMELVAAQNGGSLDTTYSDCLGRKHCCWLGIRTGNFKRGLGLQIEESGQVSFVFDAASILDGSERNAVGQARFILDSGDAARALSNEITRTYAALATQEAMTRLGLRVETRAPEVGASPCEVVGRDALGRQRVLSVAPDGEIELDLVGFSGEACVAAENALRASLTDYGLSLEVTRHRRKDQDGTATFARRARLQVGGV